MQIHDMQGRSKGQPSRINDDGLQQDKLRLCWGYSTTSWFFSLLVAMLGSLGKACSGMHNGYESGGSRAPKCSDVSIDIELPL
jgi:hypothetical protein